MQAVAGELQGWWRLLKLLGGRQGAAGVFNDAAVHVRSQHLAQQSCSHCLPSHRLTCAMAAGGAGARWCSAKLASFAAICDARFTAEPSLGLVGTLSLMPQTMSFYHPDLSLGRSLCNRQHPGHGRANVDSAPCFRALLAQVWYKLLRFVVHAQIRALGPAWLPRARRVLGRSHALAANGAAGEDWIIVGIEL